MKTGTPNGKTTCPKTLAGRLRTACATTLLPLLLLLLTLPTVAQAQFNYTITNGTVTITGYTGAGGDVIIPDTIGGPPVASIGTGAFTNTSALTGVTIPGSVASIGDYAFSGCTGLSNVYFKGNAPGIGADVFADASPTIYYLPGTTGWGPTFSDRPTARWFLPSPLILSSGPVFGVRTNAFGFVISWATDVPVVVTACTNLASPAWTPVSTNTLADGQFWFSDLQWTNYPARFYRLSAPSAQPQGYSWTTNNGAITITRYSGSNSAVTIPSLINGLPVTALGPNSIQVRNDKWPISVTIPDSVLSIGNDAFYACTTLTNVTLGHSVTNIGTEAFRECYHLAGITIPDSAITIGNNAFEDCWSLASAAVGNGATSIGMDAFMDCYSLTNLTLGSNVGSIGGWAFGYCYGLRSVTLPNSLTNLGFSAFFSCTNLAAITLSTNLGSIAGQMFWDCFHLTSVEIPDSVTHIDTSAFAYCTGLAHVTIGHGVTNIGNTVFYDCGSLTNVIIPSSVTSIGSTVFLGCNSMDAIMVDVLNPAYSSVDGVLLDKAQTTIIQCPAGKTGSCTFPATVTNIMAAAFYYCTRLTGVYFQGNAPAGSSVFNTANQATAYYLPGTTGWDTWPGGIATAVWKPRIETGDAGFGVCTNQFGFNINWASNMVVVVEACTNLANPDWLPLQTNTLTTSSLYFGDPGWTNYPTRFYRLRSP